MNYGLERCKEKLVSDQLFANDNVNDLSENKKAVIDRWRLILGKKAEDHQINFSSPGSSGLAGQSSSGQSNIQGKSGSRTQQRSGQEKKQAQPRTIAKRTTKVGKEIERKEEESQTISQLGSKRAGDQPASQTPQPTILKQIDNTLNFVYEPRKKKRGADLSSSRLSIPKWIENVKNFFPKQTKEVLEKDLIERSDLKDIIKNPELFEKVEPSLEMVKVIIGLKHMLPENIKNVARKIVKKVVDALKGKLKQEVERHIVGAIKRDKHTPIKVFRNIDWKQSIQKNLKHYDLNIKKLIMAEPRFFSAERRKKPWQIVVLIDESGSMTDSVIYSIVMASIFSSLPSVHTNLIIFDTQVVDLSSKLDDPVDILMSVQLGGGTDITRAVRYGQSLIKKPKKAIMVIISDFYEGRNYRDLTKALKHVLEGQTKILGIAALGYDSEPMYDRRYAKEMNGMGIDVLACTPQNLPEIIAKLMK